MAAPRFVNVGSSSPGAFGQLGALRALRNRRSPLDSIMAAQPQENNNDLIALLASILMQQQTRGADRQENAADRELRREQFDRQLTEMSAQRTASDQLSRDQFKLLAETTGRTSALGDLGFLLGEVRGRAGADVNRAEVALGLAKQTSASTIAKQTRRLEQRGQSASEEIAGIIGDIERLTTEEGARHMSHDEYITATNKLAGRFEAFERKMSSRDPAISGPAVEAANVNKELIKAGLERLGAFGLSPPTATQPRFNIARPLSSGVATFANELGSLPVSTEAMEARATGGTFPFFKSLGEDIFTDRPFDRALAIDKAAMQGGTLLDRLAGRGSFEQVLEAGAQAGTTPEIEEALQFLMDSVDGAGTTGGRIDDLLGRFEDRAFPQSDENIVEQLRFLTRMPIR